MSSPSPPHLARLALLRRACLIATALLSTSELISATALISTPALTSATALFEAPGADAASPVTAAVAGAGVAAAPSSSAPTSSALSSSALSSPALPSSAPSPSTRIPRGRAAWAWPLPAPHAVTRGYAPPAERYGPGHRGIDLATEAGASVTAPDDGVVSFAGRVVDRPVLSLDLGAGVVASLEPVTASVRAGDAVVSGQQIGVVATGGHCDAACVHLGARIDGEYVNPLLFLGLAPRAVLLPLGR